MKLSKTERTLAAAAAKSGMDEKTGRKYRRLGVSPSQTKKAREYRTRPDPLLEVWPQIEKLVKEDSSLEAVTILDHLSREHPDKFQNSQLRTLQRRLKVWRAQHGERREVFFPQEHVPGRQGQSDFTYMNELGITIGGQRFDHMFYHFTLTYSNWEWGSLCFSESFESLSHGVQSSLWELGGVPAEHRTDSLSAAVTLLGNRDEFTARYRGLLEHYGMDASHTSPGRGNENGDVEQSHYRFKRAVEQALLLRGSRDFGGMAEYAQFLKDLFAQRNAGRRARLTEEMAVMGELPARRMESAKRERVKVDSGSLIHVERNSYSVNSRLIGARVEARMYLDHVEVWYGQKKVEDLPRLRGRSKHRIDYRHIIEWLVRKPGAFENYRYQEDLFPTSRFRMAYDALKESAPSRCSSEYLKILKLAAERGEVQVDEVLRALLEGEAEAVITAETISERLSKMDVIPPVTMVEVAMVDLANFDQLFTMGASQ